MATRFSNDSEISHKSEIKRLYLTSLTLYEEEVEKIAFKDLESIDSIELQPQYNISHHEILNKKVLLPREHKHNKKRETFKNARAISISPAGLVYMADHTNSRIVEFNLDGKVTRSFRDEVFIKGPWGVLASDKHLYVTDIDNNCLLVIDIGTGKLTFTQYKYHLKSPRQLAINEGEIWIPDNEINEVLIVRASHDFKLITQLKENLIISPMDVKFRTGKAYILNSNGKIFEFEQATRKHIRSIELCAGSKCYFFTIMQDLFLISDATNKSVLMFDIETKKKIGELGKSLEQIPLGIDVHQDRVYVIYPFYSFPWRIF